jgi:hypothetical protein
MTDKISGTGFVICILGILAVAWFIIWFLDLGTNYCIHNLALNQIWIDTCTNMRFWEH